MIKFGIRQSFDKIEQVEERYSNLNAPVEVALPYYWDIYEPVRRHLAEIAEKIKSYGTTVLSIHAVQAPITDEKFKIWGKEIADFATTIGVRGAQWRMVVVQERKTIGGESFDNN
jgi:hypothetical protein